jgi:hypothetical protein
MNDRDALLRHHQRDLLEVDAYLKENERDNISALMIAGGWVEGLYIATQVSHKRHALSCASASPSRNCHLNDLFGTCRNLQVDDPRLEGVKADLPKLCEAVR